MDDLLSLSIRLDESVEDRERADSVLRDLLYEVRELDVDRADLETRPGPPGSKGPETAGLVVNFTASIFSLVAAAITLKANLPAIIKFEGPLNGVHYKFSGTSREFKKLVSNLPPPSDNVG